MHFFFKCINPRQAIWLSEFNTWLNFENVDNEVGIFQTTRQDVAEAIRKVDGSFIREITAAEFAELTSKKKSDLTLPRQWREELDPARKRPAADTVAVSKPQSAASSRISDPPAAAAPEPPKPPARLVQAPVPTDTKPKVRRKRPPEPPPAPVPA